MYLLRRIFPGSELDALAELAGRFRNIDFFDGSHDPGRRPSPDPFLNPSDFGVSEYLELPPLGAVLRESDPRVFEFRESEPREAEPLNSELLESELREVVPLESELREDRLTAASRLEAELREAVPLAGRRTGESDFV